MIGKLGADRIGPGSATSCLSRPAASRRVNIDAAILHQPIVENILTAPSAGTAAPAQSAGSASAGAADAFFACKIGSFKGLMASSPKARGWIWVYVVVRARQLLRCLR